MEINSWTNKAAGQSTRAGSLFRESISSVRRTVSETNAALKSAVKHIAARVENSISFIF